MPKEPNPSRTSLPSYADVVAACAGDRAAAGPAQTWATTHTLFCDETGNSGSNFNDPAQPLYIEGGWFVAHEKRAALEAVFAEIERSFNFGPKTKGTNLKGSPRGQKCLAAALDAVSRDATPFFYLVEKRYFVCAKAVETFFDPYYNPAVDPVETFDPRIRKERADILYAAPDPVVRAFGESFRQEDPVGIAAAGAEWATALLHRREHGMAMQLRVCLPKIGAHMANEFQKLRGAGLPRGYATLNAPSLAQVFQLIEKAGPACDLMHDQCDTFAVIYRHFFDLYRNAQTEVLPRLDGTGDVFGFRRLNSLDFARTSHRRFRSSLRGVRRGPRLRGFSSICGHLRPLGHTTTC